MGFPTGSGSLHRRLTVAIDGPAGAGKSTVAQRVALALRYVYIDTGAMYRGVTWKCLHQGLEFQDVGAMAELAGRTTVSLVPPTEPDGKQRVLVDGRDVTTEIRTPEVTQKVSQVAAQPLVRQVLTAQQQNMGAAGGVVMDGRDIGTAVFPFAEVKIFLTASVQTRTQRRYLELVAQGHEVDRQALEQELVARDLADSQRSVAPLRPADDAVVVSTDGLSIEGVVADILSLVEARREDLSMARR